MFNNYFNNKILNIKFLKNQTNTKLLYNSEQFN